ncbi:LLGL scribble cell polarity complex component 2-like isoform X4 [Lytechinus variegatus]|uniref:LLGL scribble cell polarity complex component 2-like isoform X4 n=1 Tax=Lytechinus variegatus TaxID=7654 RepID=UPI001BB20403|nr:LLGL scribble cell polarity complex component 2-like isoform X4 [Lytechinus variegatus]
MASRMRKLFHRQNAAAVEERRKMRKDLFAFNKTVEHGFPNKPTALAYDPKLNIFAIGTSNGVIKIYGAPGVEFIGIHSGDFSVSKLFFLPAQGRIISLLDDNSLHLWEINQKDGGSTMDEVKNFMIEGRLKKISVCCLSSDSSRLYLGTEGGNIYLLDVESFELEDHIVYQDVVMQKLNDSPSSSVPDDFKVNPGAVEAIAQHPSDKDRLLIGYNRGLMIIWFQSELMLEASFVGHQIESLCWHRDGTHFTSSHNDGSYQVWKVSGASSPAKEPLVPYGPFPCKAIPKILYLTTKSEPFTIFSGGMPRASYGDRHVVTVIQDKTQHVVFDFTSKVIDFFTMSNATDEDEFDEPHTLVVLVEEEIVFIDLQTKGWPTFQLPYLSSLHASAITSSNYISNVPSQLWEKIQEAGEHQQQNTASQREFPVCGGKNLVETPAYHDLLLTGHEDGSIRFWDASSSALKFLYQVNVAHVFTPEGEQNSSPGVVEAEEEWPPFRKVGNFDPFSDDPRLGIQKVVLCPQSGTLVSGGTAGQVVVMKMGDDEEEKKTVEAVQVKIVVDDKFVWKGHEALPVREEPFKLPRGFQVELVAQAHPPAAITALAFQSTWGIAAFGTGHGFSLIDTTLKRLIQSHCTLNPDDLSVTGEHMSRRKSLTKSLRASLRRVRQKRGTAKPRKQRDRRSNDTGGKVIEGSDNTPTTPEKESRGRGFDDADLVPIERKIEARSEDPKVSMVRYVYFANTFVRDAHTATPSLWVGTNAGIIYIYSLGVPTGENRVQGNVMAEISKEIKLKHGAPINSMVVVDSDNNPLPDPIEVQHECAKPPNMSGHNLIVCSEEQFKVFALPSLKPRYKTKLTAMDGSKVRKVAFINYRSKNNESYNENHISCLTNQGELGIYSIPHLKRQDVYQALRKENVTGIASLLFTPRGEGMYLLSPSEFERFTMSARTVTEPLCMLELAEGMRPVPPEPEVEPEPEPEPAAEATEDGEKADEAAGGDAAAAAAGVEVAKEAKADAEEQQPGEEDAKQPSDEPPAAILQNGPSEEATTEEPTAGGDAETAAAIEKEVENQTADGINISIEGETDDNPDITIDEVKEYDTKPKEEIVNGTAVPEEDVTIKEPSLAENGEIETNEVNGEPQLEKLQIEE